MWSFYKKVNKHKLSKNWVLPTPVLPFFFKLFPKQISPKNIFFKNIKFLFIGAKQFFSPQKHFFCQKQNCLLNCPFFKNNGFCFALQIQSVSGLHPTVHFYEKITTKPSSYLFLNHVDLGQVLSPDCYNELPKHLKNEVNERLSDYISQEKKSSSLKIFML